MSTPYATFGLVCENGYVVRAAPIAKWAIGRPVDDVKRYYRTKGAKVLTIRSHYS